MSNPPKLDVYDESEEANDRMKFIRKVYGILAVQLVLTAGLIAWVQNSEGMRMFA